MEQGGNRMVNRIFEANLQHTSDKPTATAEMSTRSDFCRRKYIQRKYYQAFEYQDAMRAIRTAASVSHNNFSSTMDLVNPFLRDKPVAVEVPVYKEPISDEEFFKCMIDDEDWKDPFQMINNKPELVSQQGRKDKKGSDGMSRSWHPESPSKGHVNQPLEASSSKTRGTRSGAVMRPKSKCRSDIFTARKQLNMYEEDDGILYSHCKTDSVVTSSTANSTTKSSRKSQSDMLSATCHPSHTKSNRLAPKELCNFRHCKSDHMCETHDLGRPSDPSLNHQTDSVTKPSRFFSSSGRPRVQRRSSATALMDDDVEKIPPTTTSSNLVVEALLDFIQATTNVTEEEINMIMNTANKRREGRNREVYAGHRQEDRSMSASRSPRPGRLQKSASFARRGERSRSSSRTRAPSRSRRAVMSRRYSLNDDLDEGNRTKSPRRNLDPSLERKSRARQTRNKKRADDGCAAAGPSKLGDSVERNVPSGGSRLKNSKIREPCAHSGSGSGCARSIKRNDSRHGCQRRGANLSGRRRRGTSRDDLGSSDQGSGGDVPRRQKHDPISVSGRSLHEELAEGRDLTKSDKQQFERGSSFGSCSDSTTVSEASDIVDEDDLLIM
jgi:hypothetical protein